MNDFENFVLAHLDQSWDWDGLSSNPSISPDFVLATLDMPWDWDICGLSGNSFKTHMEQ
jgi:hypothetical protein